MTTGAFAHTWQNYMLLWFSSNSKHHRRRPSHQFFFFFYCVYLVFLFALSFSDNILCSIYTRTCIFFRCFRACLSERWIALLFLFVSLSSVLEFTHSVSPHIRGFTLWIYGCVVTNTSKFECYVTHGTAHRRIIICISLLLFLCG